MANYAYLSLWFRDFTIEKGLTHLEALLGLFPVSAARPGLPAGQAGFRLVVRSLDLGQTPSLEADLLATPADVRTAASEFPHEDTAYEVTAYWDLWQPRGQADWEQGPAPAEIILRGEEFDPDRVAAERDHLQVNLGPENLYLSPAGPPQDLSIRYTRENVRRLYAFLRALEKQLPLSQRRLWSEGEPDFSARTEQLLAL